MPGSEIAPRALQSQPAEGGPDDPADVSPAAQRSKIETTRAGEPVIAPQPGATPPPLAPSQP